MFEVREKADGKYYVSVLNAYYRKWMEAMEAAMNGTKSINVHIDQLVNGGYVCHCDIAPLTQLTGQSFTSSVFIPGSHIVLNIERDFERWIGKDVTIIPQKFVDFVDTKVGSYNHVIEKSLVGSRKRVLQLIGNQYLYDMYNTFNDPNVERESYTGIVTGIINSIKKSGVFVELNDKYITGLLPLDSADLLDYKPGDEVTVKIKEFEVQPDKEPFILNKNNKVVKCHTRPVFELG
jgi:ribosomal protein S1